MIFFLSGSSVEETLHPRWNNEEHFKRFCISTESSDYMKLSVKMKVAQNMHEDRNGSHFFNSTIIVKMI